MLNTVLYNRKEGINNAVKKGLVKVHYRLSHHLTLTPC
jgi:hypothetical protein